MLIFVCLGILWLGFCVVVIGVEAGGWEGMCGCVGCVWVGCGCVGCGCAVAVLWVVAMWVDAH